MKEQLQTRYITLKCKNQLIENLAFLIIAQQTCLQQSNQLQVCFTGIYNCA